MPRGYACIALAAPKHPENVGAVLRAARCYDVVQVNIAGMRRQARDGLRHATNTTKAHRHMPVFLVANPLDYVPLDAETVAIEIVPDAMSLPTFRHPPRAVYVFGGEDRTLDTDLLDAVDHRVMVPTRYCMNLACCVNVVLYDRMAKQMQVRNA